MDWTKILFLLTCVVIAGAILLSNKRETFRNDTYSRFYYITVATKPHPVLDVLKQTVASKGEMLTVLGMKEDRDIGWYFSGNFGVKLREVYDFIFDDDRSPNDIVLFTDAYDVYYCGNLETLLERYREFGKPIVFGAEVYCSPIPARAADYPAADKTHFFPYLNSGMFIGRVDALRACMRDYQYKDAQDDQIFWTDQYLAHPDLITLDHENRLFLNCVALDEREILVHDGDQVTFRGATPQLVHANGGDKYYLDPMVQYRASLM